MDNDISEFLIVRSHQCADQG